jgi:DUF1707 SHOCT-like domain
VPRRQVVDRLRSALEDGRLTMDEYVDRMEAAVSVNVVVWALVSGTGGHLAYPWPVWVAGPYGAVLFAVSAGVTLFRRSRPPVAHARTPDS